MWEAQEESRKTLPLGFWQITNLEIKKLFPGILSFRFLFLTVLSLIHLRFIQVTGTFWYWYHVGEAAHGDCHGERGPEVNAVWGLQREWGSKGGGRTSILRPSPRWSAGLTEGTGTGSPDDVKFALRSSQETRWQEGGEGASLQLSPRISVCCGITYDMRPVGDFLSAEGLPIWVPLGIEAACQVNSARRGGL